MEQLAKGTNVTVYQLKFVDDWGKIASTVRGDYAWPRFKKRTTKGIICLATSSVF
jgi:hypothetical protein